MTTAKKNALAALEYAIDTIKSKSQCDVITGYHHLIARFEEHLRPMLSYALIDSNDADETRAANLEAERGIVALAGALAAIVGVASADSITFDAGVAKEHAEPERSVVMDQQADDVGFTDMYALNLIFNDNHQCCQRGCQREVEQIGGYCHACVISNKEVHYD